MQDDSTNNDDNFSKKHFASIISDKLATFIIYSGGLLTIIAVIGILAFVLWEALPLINDASWKKSQSLNTFEENKYSSALITGIDEYREIAYILNDSCRVDFIDVVENKLIKSVNIDSLLGKKISSVSKSINDNYVGIGTVDGYIAAIFIAYSISFNEESERIIEPSIELIDFFLADSLNLPIKNIVFRSPYHDLKSIFYQLNNNKLCLKTYEIEKNFLTEEENVSVFSSEIKLVIDDEISVCTLDDISEKLIIGSKSGKLYYYSLKNPSNTEFIQIISQLQSPITSLSFLLGDQTFVVGDSSGNILTYSLMLDPETNHGWKFNEFKRFPNLKSVVTSIAVSSRNKNFLVGNDIGNIKVNHLTTGKTILELADLKNKKVIDISYAPKADGAVVLFSDGELIGLEINSRHPEFSIGTIFGKVLYEGYSKPEYVWQSTGGTDDFEPKFSLVPLIFGTLKGTFFAMLFAVPISLFAAVYTALFMKKKIRNYIKPSVEMMAALPSVVIGFLASIWLAPLLDRILPAILLFGLVVLILVITLIFLNSSRLKSNSKLKINPGYEIYAVLPLLIIGLVISYYFGESWENIVFGGDFKIWLQNVMGYQYEQRNGIVVGFALGFAVVPVIYTIGEDALHNVPENLTSAAYSLGANKWQTAWRVIIPTASPGIFSAVMIGFGRAIGETMIVLMATGNTPIMDMNIFNGMRTLSANIAIEIPEAPVGGTLYRVLFLSASLLFVLTFIINSIAEVVRQKLRKKYMSL